MHRNGFTLIELLIVVVIIGILAAIAIPKFANTKQKAYLASMKTDLRNLVTAEEAYFADSIKYANSVCAAAPCAGALFVPTTGNVLANPVKTSDGWTATITNVNMTGANAHTCAIYIGSTAVAPATKEGEPKCN
jgi:prepilin-type N-terminal cleavage/methylation domain-containing protein